MEDSVSVDEINEQLQHHEVFEDDVGFNRISETYSEHFIKSPKYKYGNYKTRPEYQTKEMISRHYAAHQPHNQNNYQSTKLITHPNQTDR